MNSVAQSKANQPEPLSRADIADILMSLGKPGENREEKRRVVKAVCEQRGEGRGYGGHPIWDTLADFPQW